MDDEIYQIDELYPTTVFVHELENEDVQMRLNSIRQISTIALALGEEATREELIPLLTQVIFDEEDVLIALAEQLGELIDYVGGPEFAACLLTPLEGLVTVEDAHVRSKAIASLRRITAVLSDDDLAEHMLPLLTRLIGCSWFTARVSACSLFTSVYARIDDALKENLRVLFRLLCEDKIVLVRSTAASVLADFTKIVEPQHLKTEIMEIFLHFVEDEKDSVRFLAISCGIIIAERLKEHQICDPLIMAFRLCVSDVSWRVRFNIADKFLDLQHIYGLELSQHELLPALECLLRDDKPKVRAHIVSKTCQFCANLKQDMQMRIIECSILPHLRFLCDDANLEVKSATIVAIMHLSRLLGGAETIRQLLPLLAGQFKSDNNEVCLNFITHFDVLTEVVGGEQLIVALLPIIKEFAAEPKWRARYTVIRYMPTFAANFGQALFDRYLLELFRAWIIDRVYAIREGIGISIRDVIKIFGDKWAEESVLPLISQSLKSSHYLHRISCLHCIGVITPWCGVQLNTERMLPMVLEMATDKVVNVIFNVVKTLRNMLPYVTQAALNEKIKPMLEQFCNSADDEVQSTARLAVNALHTMNLQSEEHSLTESLLEANEVKNVNEELTEVIELSILGAGQRPCGFGAATAESSKMIKVRSEEYRMNVADVEKKGKIIEIENEETHGREEMNVSRETDEIKLPDEPEAFTCSSANEKNLNANEKMEVEVSCVEDKIILVGDADSQKMELTNNDDDNNFDNNVEEVEIYECHDKETHGDQLKCTKKIKAKNNNEIEKFEN